MLTDLAAESVSFLRSELTWILCDDGQQLRGRDQLRSQNLWVRPICQKMNLNDCAFKVFCLRCRHLHSDQYFVAGLRARQQRVLVQMRSFEDPMTVEIDRLV
jgi:hypothetical protein